MTPLEGPNRGMHPAVPVLALCCVLFAVWLVLPHPILIVILCALPLGVVFVLGNTYLMVVLFIIFSFFRIHEVFPQLYSLKIPLLLSLASLFALGWHVGISKKIQMFWRPEMTVATVFFVLVLIGVVAASNRPMAINYFKSMYWKIIIMMYAIIWLTRTHKEFSIAGVLTAVFGSMVASVAISNSLQGIGLVEGSRVTIGRDFGSVLGDPNDLALVLMYPMAFAVRLLVGKDLPRWQRFIGLIAVPLLFYAVLATQSRGGLLGIMAVFGVFAYRRVKSKALLGTVGVLAAAVLYVAAGVGDRKSGGAGEEGIDASAQGRLYAWEAAFYMAVENPLTGVGLDNFYVNYFFYSRHWDGLNHAVHSTWFGVLAETGFLGLGVFIAFIAVLFRSSLRSLKLLAAYKATNIPAAQVLVLLGTCEALIAGLAGTVVAGTFLTQGFTWPIYLLAGQIIAVSRWVACHVQNDNTPQNELHNATDPYNSSRRFPKLLK